MIWRLSFDNDTVLWIRAASEKAARRRYLELQSKWVPGKGTLTESWHARDRPRITKVTKVKRPEHYAHRVVYD